MNAVSIPEHRTAPLVYPSANSIDDVERGEPSAAVNFGETLWRYRWAVALPFIMGAVIGVLIFLQLPETYRSTARLMIESDQPPILDSMNGEFVRGVPSVEIVESQLFSDWVLANAFSNESLTPFHDKFDNDFAEFVGVVSKNMEVEAEVDDLRTVQSVVTLVHFDSTEEELCQPTVQAFTRGLQAFYHENYRSNRSELMNMITSAVDELDPKLAKLEQRRRDFQRTSPLAWDSDNRVINPHREAQMFLIAKRSAVEEALRKQRSEVYAIEQTLKAEFDDPLLALRVVGQLLDRTFNIEEKNERLADLQQGDFELADIMLSKDLVPLMIERDKVAAEFGDKHPTVKTLDLQLQTMRTELEKLIEEQTSRIMELMSTTLVDPQKRAIEAVGAVQVASKAQLSLLQDQLRELDAQITREREEAAKLYRYEQEYESLTNDINRTRSLLEELQKQMALFDMGEEDRGTRVIELKAPTRAYQVGPSLLMTVGLGGLLGLALGGGLAFLLEKNANTFRDPDEVQHALGVPVWAHIPFYKPKRKRLLKGDNDPFAVLDPTLATAHHPASVMAEAIRSCRTHLFFEMPSAEGDGKIIHITSPLPGDGKSTIAGNLAISIAQSNKRVLVIDCDLRRPQISDNFGVSDSDGLTKVLNGDCEPGDACHATPVENLFVMPSGETPANPAEALTLGEMQRLLSLLRQKFDYIILDSPPLLVVTDPSILASMADAVLMTMRIRRKSRQNAKESLNVLRAVNAKVLGVLINNSDEAGSSDGYRGYGYYRYGRYTDRYRRNAAVNEKSDPLVIAGGRSKALAKPAVVQTGASANRSATEPFPNGPPSQNGV